MDFKEILDAALLQPVKLTTPDREALRSALYRHRYVGINSGQAEYTNLTVRCHPTDTSILYVLRKEALPQ